MVEINEALTRKLADLARLELTPEEVAKFTTQMKQVLGYVEQLNQVKTDGVEPMTHALRGETPMREDEARPSPTAKDGSPRVLEAAPESLENGFKVPPIL